MCKLSAKSPAKSRQCKRTLMRHLHERIVVAKTLSTVTLAALTFGLLKHGILVMKDQYS